MKKNKTKSLALALLLCLLACVLGLAACTNGNVRLTFYNGEETVAEFTGKSGEQIGDVPLPVKTGYTFTGWATAKGEPFTSAELPSKNTKVYAQFAANTYTVTFHYGRGKVGVPVTVDAVYDAAVNVPAEAFAFSREGFTLAGWATEQNADAADFTLQGDIRNLTAVKGENVTLYAYYTPNSVVEDFVVENGTVYAYIGSSDHVTLPDTAQQVADYAFEDAEFTDVVVPASYTDIGFGAFAGCDRLQRLTVPFIGGSRDGNAFLGYIFGAASYADNTFSYTIVDVDNEAQIDESTLSGSFFIPRSLRVVTLNDTVTAIPEGAFYYAFGLEKVVVYPTAEPNGGESYPVKTVEKSAFEGCHRIGYDSVTDTAYRMQWLSGVETFEEKAFFGYVSANSRYVSRMETIGELTAVKTIGKQAFANNYSVSSLSFGDSLQTIGEEAFSSLNMLQRLIIPDSCVSIGNDAFSQCIYLASVTVGKNVQTIGEGAFAYSAALTEVFFKGQTLPSLGAKAFNGLELGADGTPNLLETCNAGTVFYFENNTDLQAGKNTLSSAYPTAQAKVAGNESKRYYYEGENGFDLCMYFSRGHMVIVSDPYGRIGFGIPELVGKWQKETENVWYDAEIYTATFLLTEKFVLQCGYAYVNNARVETFNVSQPGEAMFQAGDKATIYLEENKWGQIGLWENGQMVPLAAGAVGATGEITQQYIDGSPRTFVYRQYDAYKQAVGADREFVYTPDPQNPDGDNVLHGTFTEAVQNQLFGMYTTTDGFVQIFIDEKTHNLQVVRNNWIILDGTYETDDTFGEETYVATHGNIVVTFTGYAENIVDGNYLRKMYARASFRYDSDKANYHLYNRLFTSVGLQYKVDKDNLIDDYYIMVRYSQQVSAENGQEPQYEFVGYGEHVYMDGNMRYYEYFSYTQADNNYTFTFTDGTVRTTDLAEYAPFYSQEADVTLTSGDVSIKLSGFGRAVYTDAQGNAIKGSYVISSDEPVANVYADSTSYYNLYEYTFRSDDGTVVQCFVPNFYDSFDGSLHAGDMLLPDEMKGKTYKIYDADGVCTGEFTASGYGLGTLRILRNENGDTVADSGEAYGSATVLYAQAETANGKPVYKLYSRMGQGYFLFTPAESGDNGAQSNTLNVYPEYYDWWRSAAAVNVTGGFVPETTRAARA